MNKINKNNRLFRSYIYLFVTFLLELISATALLFFAIINYLTDRINIYNRMFSPDLSRFEKFLLHANNEYVLQYLYVLIYPFFCLLLLGCLLYLARANKKYRVIGNESLWTLLFGVSLPSLLLILCSSRLLNEWYVPVASITFWWIFIGIFPLNILLIRNLVQYTKAIRQAKERSAIQSSDH